LANPWPAYFDEQCSFDAIVAGFSLQVHCNDKNQNT
jgi:hypothetical protein